MPRSKEQKRLFLELIAKAKELYDSIKGSIKDSRTKLNYSYLVNNSNNMNSLGKVIRELSLFKKYKGPVVKANLTKLKKQDHLLSNLSFNVSAPGLLLKVEILVSSIFYFYRIYKLFFLES